MWYDVVVLAILGFAVYRGARKGIVWQLAAIAALVLCFAFAESASLAIAPLLGLKPPLNRWVAMLILYVGLSFLAFGAARMLKEAIEKAKFEEFDRHLGAIFGFVKGAVFALFVTFFAVTLSEKLAAAVMNSYSGTAAAIVMDRLHPVMPRELHDVLAPYIHSLDRPDLDLHHRDHDHIADDHGTPGFSEPGSSGNDPFYGSSSPDDHSPFDKPGDMFHDDESFPRDSSADTRLLELVGKLPGIYDDDLRSQVLRALKNTSPEHRRQLLSELSTGIPTLIRRVAREWENGRPDTAVTHAGGSSTTRERLLRDISSIYSDYPDAQEALIEEVEASLTGVPDQVIDAAIRDWHVDVMASGTDPDPQTSLTTPLDVRIARQLSRAGIPLNSLSSSLQNRLGRHMPR